MNFAFGDIYLTNFSPSVGREYRKTRPALVVQQSNASGDSPYVTVLPITSNLKNYSSPDVFLQKSSKNRLFCDSVIKVRQIASFDKRRFVKHIGSIESPALRQVRGCLRKHFGF